MSKNSEVTQCLDSQPGDGSHSDFDYEWYLVIKLQIHGTPEACNNVLVDIETDVQDLFNQMNTLLGPENVNSSTNLYPHRLIDSTEQPHKSQHIGYHIIGLPTIAPSDLPSARKIVKDWQSKITLSNKDTVQASFTPRKLFLSRSFIADTIILPPPLASSPQKSQKPEPRTITTFKKLKSSNPHQVRQQFMQHAMSASSQPSGSDSSSTAKLRPVKEVLKRLKYDERYEIKDYVVGIIDRKEGIVEMGVQEWEKYGEEELVAYFRDVRDQGGVMWDRARKIDRFDEG